jgi:AraC family transcriptional regulator
MNYERQIGKVIDFIGKHLDDKLTLDQLSKISYFSKHHFHRIFTAYASLSLQQYIRWLRLKRAAHQLIVDKDKPIIEIAINAGFESHVNVMGSGVFYNARLSCNLLFLLHSFDRILLTP